VNKPILFLFDLDATLVRTGGAGMLAMNQAFTEYFGWQDALSHISPAGRTDTSIAHELSNKYQGRDMAEDEMGNGFARYLGLLVEKLETAKNFRVLPGIRAFLEKAQAQKDYVLALGTGNLEQGARIKLEPPDLNRFFPFGGFGSEAVVRSELLRIAVARAEDATCQKISMERVLVIGDTQHDIRAGKEIGARTVGVATGPYTTRQLSEHQPDLVLENFTQILELDRFLSGF